MLRSARLLLFASFVLAAPLVIPAEAHASVVAVNTFNGSGTAYCREHRNVCDFLGHIDSGSYAGSGQIGIGVYHFWSTYSPAGCTNATYTGTAMLIRSDGAILSGTLTGTSTCTGPSTNATFTVTLTACTGGCMSRPRDFEHATFDVNCSWGSATTISGTPTGESCRGSGTLAVTHRIGYASLDDHGQLHVFGGPYRANRIAAPGAIAMAGTGDGAGYWILDTNGRVSSVGTATSFGGVNVPPDDPARAVAATPAGDGVWVFTARGRVFALGAAPLLGDVSTLRLNRPIVAAAAAPDGKGYWMVASDGGVFAFGSAKFFGSAARLRLNRPVVGIAATESGKGYWLVASDGGVFSFGDAPFRGSLGNMRLNRPVTAVSRYGSGYLLVAADDGVFDFGTTPSPNVLDDPSILVRKVFFGTDQPADNPVVAVVAVG
jgi:ribosomal protein L24E